MAYLEDYVEATEKVHKAHAKEYEKVLKTISQPLREGRHFDQGLGGVAGYFENMRVNTQVGEAPMDTGNAMRRTALTLPGPRQLQRRNREDHQGDRAPHPRQTAQGS